MKDYLINKRLNELCPNGYLNNEKNTMLFRQYQQDKLNGVPLEDSEARTLLILGNTRLIYFVLRSKLERIKYLNDLEEFSVGQIGLIKAIDTFNMDCGVKFVTYACKVIKNEILMHYRKLRAQNRFAEHGFAFLDEEISNDGNDGTPMRLIDVIGDENNFMEEILDTKEAESIIKNLRYLSRNEAFTIIHFYGLFGNPIMSQGEIGEILNVTRCNVSKYYTKGIYKLKVLTLNPKVLSDEDRILRYGLLKSGFQNDLNIQTGEINLG